MARLMWGQSGYEDDGVWVNLAQPGDIVVIEGVFSHADVAITVTEEGNNCDCGKGVFCPNNPQTVLTKGSGE